MLIDRARAGHTGSADAKLHYACAEQAEVDAARDVERSLRKLESRAMQYGGR